ncbi:putative translational regulatory protein ArgL [Pectobacterium carotovorum]
MNLNNYTYKVNFNSTDGVEPHGEVHHATVL